jgi:hypothetical protein
VSEGTFADVRSRRCQRRLTDAEPSRIRREKIRRRMSRTP